MEERTPAMRELFIDELAEVKGGVDPLEKVGRWIKDLLVTTAGCGEEGPPC